jgi:hypothetical protein
MSLMSNPPLWPETVLIFSPEDTDINDRIMKATSHLQDKTGHFSDSRVALLFKQGTYNIDVSVGYYVQLLGLGESVNDVVFTGEKGVYCPCADPGHAGSLDTFWRSVENITTGFGPRNGGRGGMLWAVSQASPMRRIHVFNDLLLHDCGEYASGGFMSNIQVGGNTEMGSQQQWMTRNSELAKLPIGGAWNLVYVGTTGAQETCGRAEGKDCAINNIEKTPLHAEKPFITCTHDKFYLQVPKVQSNTVGINFVVNDTDYTTIDFKQVYVASEKDTSLSIQYYINLGYHILLTPGNYQLDNTLVLKYNNQVVLGIGMATLIAPSNGKPCIYIPDILQNVRVAGIMLQASKNNIKNQITPVLFKWGEKDSVDIDEKSKANISGVIHDIFVRVGGPDVEKDIDTDIMIQINSSFVIGDNIWTWLADHSKLDDGETPKENEKYHLTTYDECKCNTGLEVNGDNVYMYGLAVEHTLKDLVKWNGNKGKVYFYQAEFPYCVNQENYGDKKYCGYRVHDDVDEHLSIGSGLYSFFRDEDCFVESAIVAPDKDKIVFVNPFTKFLTGKGGIKSVLNNKGGSMGAHESLAKIAYIN